MKKKQVPNRTQKKLLTSLGKNAKDWFVERDTSKKTVFVNRKDEELLFIVDKESI